MYLLDANAFMEANRTYYSFHLAPGFWAWLENPALAGQVASVQAIKGEITAGTGQLVEWANALPDGFWLQESDDMVPATRRLAAWAAAPERLYSRAAVDEFMASADLLLISQALLSGATVVTREQPRPESVNVVKIPDVCAAFGVPCTDPFRVYRELGLTLVSQA